MVTGLHKQLVALALELHSLHTNMDQHFQPVIAQQADGVAGLGDLFTMPSAGATTSPQLGSMAQPLPRTSLENTGSSIRVSARMRPETGA